MKKYICYICLLLVVFVHAQETDNKKTDKLRFTKNTQFVNTNLAISLTDQKTKSLDNGTTSDENNNFYNIRASYAYSVADNLFLGVGLGYSHSVITDNSNKEISNAYNIFPFVRYYKGFGKRLALYFQGEVRVGHINGDRSKQNSFSAGLRPGITFMMHKNLAFETSFGFFGYTSSNFDRENGLPENKNKAISLSLNTSNLLFGLNYYF